MSPKRLLHIPRGVLKLAIFLVLLAVGLLFALTRTQVGRDALSHRLESEFSRAFDGHLTIGKLEGDLVRDLYASDVRVTDAYGTPVLKIDSVAMVASWLDIFSRSVSIRRLELYRPELDLVRTDSTGWSFLDVLRRAKTDSSVSSTGWEFRSAEIRVVEGTVSTRNSGSLPRAVSTGRLFDFTNTRLESVHTNLTLDLGPDSRLLDVLDFSAVVPQLGLPIDDVRGQILLERDLLALSEFKLQTAGSMVSLDGSLRGADVTATTGNQLRSSVVDARVDVQKVDSSEIASIFPRTEAVGGISLQARVRGPIANLELSTFRLRKGGSVLDGSASVIGLPDSARFTTELYDSRVVFEDLAAMIPNLRRLAAPGLDTMFVDFRASGSSSGLRPGSHVTLSGEFGVVTPSGNIDGWLASSPPDSSGVVRYTGGLRSSSFDVGRAVPDLASQTVLNGTATFTASGETWDGLSFESNVLLGKSRFLGRTLDSVTVSVQQGQRFVDISMKGTHGSGGLETRAQLDLTPETAGGTWTTTFSDLDVGSLLKPFSQTEYPRLTGRVEGTHSGDSQSSLTGSLVVLVDSIAAVVRGDSVFIPATKHTATLVRPAPDSLMLFIEGDVADLNLRGRMDVEPISALLRHWTSGLSRSFDLETAKFYRIDGERILGGGLVRAPQLSPEMEVAALRSRLRSKGFSDTLSFVSTLDVHRSDAVRMFLPSLPAAPTGWRVQLYGSTNAEDLDMTLAVSSDTVQWGTATASGIRGMASGKARYGYNPARETNVTVRLEADEASLRAQDFRDFQARADFADAAGRLIINSDSATANLSSIDFDARLNLATDQNQVTIERAALSREGRTWVVGGTPRIDIYADAIIVPHLGVKKIETGRPEAEAGQLTMDGILSASSQDVFSVHAEELDLLDLSELSGFRIPFGGTLNADLRVLSAMEQPIASGNIDVEELQYDSRDLGDLSLESRYAPGSGEGMFVNLTVHQPRPAAPSRQRNEIRVDGVIDVDRRADGSSAPLALDIKADTLDLFFFEYIFDTELDSVMGTAHLDGRVGGTLSRPIFDGSIDFRESRLRVPDYNLRYTLAGPASVDREGFHIKEIELHDDTGGIATVRGDILFNDYKYFSFDLSGDLAELQIMNVERSEILPFYGQIWTSGSATLTGPLYNALLRSPDATTSPQSRVFIPIVDEVVESDKTFIVYADSTGTFPTGPDRRKNLLGRRGRGERTFVDGLDMNFNIDIPRGSSVYLVFDPLLGDVVNAVGSGRVQMQRQGGDFAAFGRFNVLSGDYLFTAGDVFARRFQIASGGAITWDGDPINARLDIPAVYRTRASLAGLPGQNPEQRVALRIDMDLTGRVLSPLVDLSIAVDRDNRTAQTIPAGLEAQLNRSDVAAEYASSVLLTNTFLLTTSQGSEGITDTADELLFHSLSQLVSSQVNRFVNEALNLDVNFGVQQGAGTEEYDLTYGFALRLNDERLVIRGEGLYETGTATTNNERLQGAFVVEYSLTPNVQIEFFFRRESDLLEAASSIGTSYGAGFVYQTEFANWGKLRKRVRQKSGGKDADDPPSSSGM